MLCVGYQACAVELAGRGYTVPLTVTGNFLSTSRKGDVDITVEVVRATRKFANVTARVVQDGVGVLLVQAIFRTPPPPATANGPATPTLLASSNAAAPTAPAVPAASTSTEAEEARLVWNSFVVDGHRAPALQVPASR